MPPLHSEDKELIAFGHAIKALRTERGLTQEDLAYRIPITVGQLSKIERGLASPRWRTMVKIASGLGLRPVELAAKAEEIRQSDSGPTGRKPA
jgi:XRE family transcriptional regulator, regulator of sulfur utilization